VRKGRWRGKGSKKRKGVLPRPCTHEQKEKIAKKEVSGEGKKTIGGGPRRAKKKKRLEDRDRRALKKKKKDRNHTPQGTFEGKGTTSLPLGRDCEPHSAKTRAAAESHPLTYGKKTLLAGGES